MGYNTIQAHRKELAEKLKIYEKLVAGAKSVTEQMNKITEAQKKLEAESMKIFAVADKLAGDMAKLDTKGIKEFEDFRQALIGLSKGGSFRPLPTKPMDLAVGKMRQSVEAEHRKWVEKLAANMPAQIKPGMVFIDKTIGNEYEVKSGPHEATNVNLRGDDAVYFKIICHRNGSQSEYPLSLAELKRAGMKYVRA